eukprot:1006974-Prymnesium_polylepis.1
MERILIGDNDPLMRNFGAGATCGNVEDVLVRSTCGGRSAGWLPRLLSGRTPGCFLMRAPSVRCTD